MSSVVLISDLLYQSAAIVFLDGGWVSEGLVKVNLAFHLFVVGTVIFTDIITVLLVNYLSMLDIWQWTFWLRFSMFCLTVVYIQIVGQRA